MGLVFYPAIIQSDSDKIDKILEEYFEFPKPNEWNLLVKANRGIDISTYKGMTPKKQNIIMNVFNDGWSIADYLQRTHSDIFSFYVDNQDNIIFCIGTELKGDKTKAMQIIKKAAIKYKLPDAFTNKIISEIVAIHNVSDYK